MSARLALRGALARLTPQRRGMRRPASTSPVPTPPPPRRVLITNDDGPDSPFFDAFVDALATATGWPAFVAPPADGQSFVAKAVGRAPVTVTKISESPAHTRVHVSGPPATAVNVVLHHLAADVDFVVSGPNVGHNAGRGAILSSGTVGAALEGAMAGRRAVALSFPFRHGFHGWTAAELARAVAASVDVVVELWSAWDDGVDLYNVNVPLDFDREARGAGGGAAPPAPLPRHAVERTTVDPGGYASLYTAAHPDAAHDFEWGPSGLRVFESEGQRAGGDVAAVAAGRVSVTPLRASLTHAGAGDDV